MTVNLEHELDGVLQPIDDQMNDTMISEQQHMQLAAVRVEATKSVGSVQELLNKIIAIFDGKDNDF